MNIEFERWTSTNNLEEIHYFLKEPHTYLVGMNPQKLSQEAQEAILNIVREDIAK